MIKYRILIMSPCGIILKASIRFIVEPNSKPKNGRIIALPPANTFRMSSSMLPRIMPRINGMIREIICITCASPKPDSP